MSAAGSLHPKQVRFSVDVPEVGGVETKDSDKDSPEVERAGVEKEKGQDQPVAKIIISKRTKAADEDAEYPLMNVVYCNELIRHYLTKQPKLYCATNRALFSEKIIYKVCSLDNITAKTLADIKPVDFLKQYITGDLAAELAELMVYLVFINDRNITLKDIGITEEGRWHLSRLFNDCGLTDFPEDIQPDFAKILNFLPFVDNAQNWFGLFENGKYISSSLLKDNLFTNLLALRMLPQFKQGVCRGVLNLLFTPLEVIKNLVQLYGGNDKTQTKFLARHQRMIQILHNSLKLVDKNKNYVKQRLLRQFKDGTVNVGLNSLHFLLLGFKPAFPASRQLLLDHDNLVLQIKEWKLMAEHFDEKSMASDQDLDQVFYDQVADFAAKNNSLSLSLDEEKEDKAEEKSASTLTSDPAAIRLRTSQSKGLSEHKRSTAVAASVVTDKVEVAASASSERVLPHLLDALQLNEVHKKLLEENTKLLQNELRRRAERAASFSLPGVPATDAPASEAPSAHPIAGFQTQLAGISISKADVPSDPSPIVTTGSSQTAQEHTVIGSLSSTPATIDTTTHCTCAIL